MKPYEINILDPYYFTFKISISVFEEKVRKFFKEKYFHVWKNSLNCIVTGGK